MNWSRQLNKRFSLVNIAVIVLPGALALVNILVSVSKAGPGFPLDDAWIHQTFARNFALAGTWAFQVGSSSGGSTSPLWTMLLVPGYWVKNLQPYVATYALGILFFVVLVWLGKKCVEVIGRDSKHLKFLIGSWILLAATAWQLIWAAGSGMETLIYSAIIMAVFYFAIARNRGWVWAAGILIGIGVWVRPDAVTLIGPVGLVLLLATGNIGSKLKNLAKVLLAMAVPVAGYLVWNLLMSGEIFPNTFYAKQAEYAVMLNAPLFARLFNVFIPLFAGACVVLLPGMVYAAWRSWKDRTYALVAIFIWCLGFGLIYALRLPVNYQHGRYMMPVLAPLILLGTVGTFEIIVNWIEKKARVSWILTRAWVMSIAIVAAAFWIRGIGQYNDDVQAINSLMVSPAKWIAANTQPADIIAVHDIGAMGYFGQRKIVDLAGLVNPEVIPIIRNEAALEEYIVEQNADYLVVLRDWYPDLEISGTGVAEFSYISDTADQTMLIRKLER